MAERVCTRHCKFKVCWREACKQASKPASQQASKPASQPASKQASESSVAGHVLSNGAVEQSMGNAAMVVGGALEGMRARTQQSKIASATPRVNDLREFGSQFGGREQHNRFHVLTGGL